MRVLLAATVIVLVLPPVPTSGWGMEIHRRLTARALEALPAEIAPFFASHRDFIIEHSVDPDLWRVVDLRTDRGDEDPNHFLDIDGLDEPRPFKNVPRSWDAYVGRYGLERATRMGRLPWRGEEMYLRLVTMFENIAKGTPAYARDNARYLVAVLAHYIEDAHQPFHAIANYDGQLTGQRGVHSRFETELVLRNWTTLRLSAVEIRPIANMRDAMFDYIVGSEALAGSVLDADRAAAAGREFYDDAYFAAFFASTRTVLERRLSESSSALASAIVSAWTAAGKPALPPDGPRPPVRIRR